MYFLDLFPKLSKILDSCLERKVKKLEYCIFQGFLGYDIIFMGNKSKTQNGACSAGKSLCIKVDNKWL